MTVDLDAGRKLLKHYQTESTEDGSLRLALTAWLIDNAAALLDELADARKYAALHAAAGFDAERRAEKILAALSVDAPLTVPDRDWESMSPKDCYEAGLLDGGNAVRMAIKSAALAEPGKS